MDIGDHLVEGRVGIGECAISLLPLEFGRAEAFFFYPSVAGFLDLPDQIRKATGWFYPDQEMDMVRHSVDGQ